MSAPAPAADGLCRVCGDPSWGSDQAGPVHRCCARVEAAGGRECGPCKVSREARRRWLQREGY